MLQGETDPALMGPSFKIKWNRHPLRDLLAVVHGQMPLNAPEPFLMPRNF